ncbi:MAG: hypothetical protein HDT37_03585 [Clostridiales bacterium]|nr:hypothetical protein [Clostridiales bacterium]
MAERKKEGMAPPALGGSSLLVAFAVLALTVFALLSLSTVRADVRLADASAQAVTDYYAADCQAQAVLAYLRTGETVPGAFPEDLVIQITFTEYVDRPGERVDAYAIPISDTQELQVEVVWHGAGYDYEILRWQAVPVGEWEPDDHLNVWGGEEE